jgi:hypothetical protein
MTCEENQMQQIRHVRQVGLGYLMALTLALTLDGCSGAASGNRSVGSAKSESPTASSKNDKLDPCAVITQEDASSLFGKPASRDSGVPVIDPHMLGECLWSWDAETGNQLLQFRIWNGEEYYGPAPDSQPFELGQKGSIRANRFAGVDIDWVQGGKTVSVSYSTTGPGAPDPLTKIEEVKQLARKAAAELSHN